MTFTPVTITMARANMTTGMSRNRCAIRAWAQLETGRLRIAQSEMGRELIAELSAFEINYTPSGNLTVDVRARDHQGDLVIATASVAMSSGSGAASAASGEELMGAMDHAPGVLLSTDEAGDSPYRRRSLRDLRPPPAGCARASSRAPRTAAGPLAAVVQERLRLDPFSGAVFAFHAKRADRMKLLVWDSSGLILTYKRLD